ncbi:MAG: glycosyltransferase [Cyanobacteria bacterium P01_G01_bin.49]
MQTSTKSKPSVTLVVVPRERFSYSRQSLESIYQNTDYPFDLVYVDVCTPLHLQRYLEEQAQQKQFKLIRTPYYISPNQARNVGLRQVLNRKSKYVVFVDNDVVVAPGWLKKLVDCAEETKATVVGPLTCIGKPEHEVIHNAGGENHIVVKEKDGKIQRCLYQKAYLTGKRVADVPEQIRRIQCEYVEFHCMLVQTAIFERIGLLDEGMLATREHIDLCMMVAEAGGTIYCERESSITTDTLGIGKNKAGLAAVAGSVQIPDFKPSDFPDFMLRWNDAWDFASLDHLRKKWNLSEEKYFTKRYKDLGSRRREILIEPLVYRLTFIQDSLWLKNILISLERQINRYFYNLYLQKLPQTQKAQGLQLLKSVIKLQSATN